MTIKILKVLPNFTVLAEVGQITKQNCIVGPYLREAVAGLSLFSERLTNLESVDTYKITPSSFWEGMDSAWYDHVHWGRPLLNLSEVLKKHSESVPENVLTELSNWEKKFGLVTLVGDDCLKINNDILKEVLNNTKIKIFTYSVDENLIFFKDIGILDLKNIFEKEIGVPIKIHIPKTRTVIIKAGDLTYAVKAKNMTAAVRSLYNKCFTEEDIRKKMGITKEVTEKDIENFFDILEKEKTIVTQLIVQRTLTAAVRL